ncbi:winged helix-turn-helix domain-containing protein [uncultured Tyzzerella sp.]|nr:winged helix-turn-helix domain-containing protein [uncultured Tyzzerella sp.]
MVYMAHISKLKANKIINELMEQECLCLHNNKRGKYGLTEKGLKVL